MDVVDSGQRIVYTYDAAGNMLSAKDETIVKFDLIENKDVVLGETLEFYSYS